MGLNYGKINGRELITWRVTSVPDTGSYLAVPSDVSYINGCIVHREDPTSTLSFSITGTVSHTASAAALIYTEGIDLVLDVGFKAGERMATLKAPSGETVNFSIIAWRG